MIDEHIVTMSIRVSDTENTSKKDLEEAAKKLDASYQTESTNFIISQLIKKIPLTMTIPDLLAIPLTYKMVRLSKMKMIR